jgi:uncharacterized protein (TIGR03083 family)
MNGLHPDALGTSIIEAHAVGLAELGRTNDLATPVPTCGAWTLGDLVWHLAEVQAFWVHVITNRPAGPDAYREPARPTDHVLPDALADQCALLVTALDAADPADAAWSWSDDHTVGFTIRRQTHEAVVHHFDGLLAVGAELATVDPSLAADGVDELVTVMLSGVPAWAAFERTDDTIQLIATDTGDTWSLAFGRMTGTSPNTGTSHDLTAFEVLDHVGDPSTVVSASALDLEMWMWGRPGDTVPAVSGDPENAIRLRTAVHESTQ